MKYKKYGDKKLLMYDGNKKYTFINAGIWECIKFWLLTKLSGGDLDK